MLLEFGLEGSLFQQLAGADLIWFLEIFKVKKPEDTVILYLLDLYY